MDVFGYYLINSDNIRLKDRSENKKEYKVIIMQTIIFLIVGLLLIIGGIWTFIAAKHWLHSVKKQGTDNGFILMGISSGFIFSILILGLGISYFSQAIISWLK